MNFTGSFNRSLAVGMKLYGKKNNEIWYKGSLVDIQNKDGPQHEVIFCIRSRSTLKICDYFCASCS